MSDEPTGRRGRQYLSLVVAAALYLLVPLLVAVAVNSTSARTTVLLVVLPLGSLALGLVDVHLFRPTASFPIMCTVFMWISTAMYFNDGTWIYAVGMGVLAWLGGRLPSAKETKD
ncbi:MAG: hypothetical protein ACHEUT_11685 [Corynebacterium pyruviciproducens]|uniref:hypothetical protein n=1 Tax=Corynebacterium pyruviciproducens TaxID=598660 RepID=UPI0039834F6B